ncbi:ABC transporter ATP-binding protein [Veillonella sp.]|uniref:ABC transporter ATP-binding protein n=1 Tax=Veillonella sp. TaxID=1926307 RepID=UPI001AF9721D|nr:ABC transporter ATP-binding protein [Veillonella sp.]MDU1673004.1 ABC transporter ATP-binding protein [Veillonella sp.]MDU1680508.1 ABC transporter ATP-binding protein [Veillonella sp.]MDU1742972.1 ABC transporter ATP-binding protein [Veillonella sp.]QRW41386.1 multidrug ABC transporter ATP-binding protein [bacterium]
MKLISSYIKPLWFSIIIVSLLSLLNVAGTLYIPTLTATIINDGVLHGDLEMITNSSATMLIVALLTVSSAILGVAMSAHISASIGKVLRDNLVKAIQAFSLRDFTHFGTGTILMRTSRDVEKIQSVLGEGLNMILPMPLMICIGLGLTFYKSWQLGLVILAVMAFMILTIIFIESRALPIIKALQLKLDTITDMVRDHIVGMPVIRAFNRRHYENTKEIEIFTETAQLNKRLRQTFAIGLPTILILFNMSTVAILWLGGYNVSIGSLQIGDIMAVIEYANLILLSMLMAIFVIIDIPEAIVCYTRIQELLEHENSDTFPEPYNKNTNLNTHYIVGQEDSRKFVDLASASASASASANDDTPLLEFRNVTFRYDNAESPALENISFTVHHGETLAIMGDIGSGKSTITNLIPRLFSIESGDILFKGKSIYEWNVDDLRSRIGYVPQKAYLFTGTVEMNIRYGAAPNQNISVQDIENACRLSKADEFISRLEGGYQYIVSQGGTNLSGGQRQRLAMARALVRKPDLFIFDDSFSALDGTTERAVRTVLHEELQKDNRPALISVEQKVSAAKKADHILIINRGQVAGYGTHDELAENSTVYKQILASQEVTE